MRLIPGLAFAVSLSLAACAQPTVVPVSPEVRSAAAAVRVHEISGDIFKLSIENLTDRTLVVNRDAIRLATPKGERLREPGGLKHEYAIPPHSVRDVNVKFSLDGLEEGAEVKLTLASALTIDGQPAPVDALPFVLR
jgi:hypothetical protein